MSGTARGARPADGPTTLLAHALSLSAQYGDDPWPDGGSPLPEERPRPPGDNSPTVPSVVRDGVESHHRISLTEGSQRTRAGQETRRSSVETEPRRSSDHPPEGDSPPDDPPAERSLAEHVIDLAAVPAPDPAELAALHDRLAELRALRVVDDLLAELQGRDLPREGLRRVGRWLCEHGWRREAVKIGIAVLGDAAEDEDRELLLLLGSLEDLTLFAAVAVRKNWSAHGVYALARRVRGWGRIHAVERLKGCTDPEIRAWLLREGFRNGVLNEYLAHLAATTGDLYGALLEPSVDEELLDSAGDLLYSLALGGPAEDIRHYPDALPALHRYLDLVRTARPTLGRLLSLTGIARILRKPYAGLDWPEGERERVVARIDELVGRPAWISVTVERLDAAEEEGNERDFNRALSCALALGLPVRTRVLRHLGTHPTNDYAWQRAIARATPEDVGELLALAERLLPLDRLAGGPDTCWQFGQEFEYDQLLGLIVQELERFPGEGVALVRAALANRVMWTRNMALHTLDAWARDPAGRLPREAAAWVDDAAAREPCEDIRERMRRFLSPEPPPPGPPVPEPAAPEPLTSEQPAPEQPASGET